MFGISRRNALIRELLEQRMRTSGFDDMSARLKVKEMGYFELKGSPEATIISILDDIIGEQRRNVPLVETIKRIEKNRRVSGNPAFNEILRMVNVYEFKVVVSGYCGYRVIVEHHGVMTSDQIRAAVLIASPSIATWYN